MKAIQGPRPKGHWPKGKARNNPTGWPELRAELVEFFDQSSRFGWVSPNVLAKAIGSTPNSVYRWLSGAVTPGDRWVKPMRAWLKKRRAEQTQKHCT